MYRVIFQSTVERHCSTKHSMIQKDFGAISKGDIEQLVMNGVTEGASIEYKEALPGPKGEDKREFLKDVTAFANAGGGDIIYGIREKRDASGHPTGIPEAADGLAGVANAESEKLRLQSLMNSGIAERIPGVRVKHLDGFANGPVILIRVPQSWVSPHMITLDNSSRFFYRAGTQIQQMDVRQIGAAFIASESLTSKIVAFRSDRVGKILAEETPIRMGSRPKMVFHLLPLQAFARAAAVDLQAAESDANPSLKPMGKVLNWGPAEFNFNGLLVCGGAKDQSKPESYVQLFRTGVIEAVTTRFSSENIQHLHANLIENVLWANTIENALREAGPRYIGLQERLGIAAPMFAAVSLVGVRGFRISLAHDSKVMAGKPIDLDVLLAPEVLVPESGAEIVKLLRFGDGYYLAGVWPFQELWL